MSILHSRFRTATEADCLAIARLMQIASDGVCDYLWTLQQEQFPELTLLEIGAIRYGTADAAFSYSNCVLAVTGDTIQGMVMAFAIPPQDPAAPLSTPFVGGSTAIADVLSPYLLEQPNSWYICALAIFPEYRRQGLGAQLLHCAAQQGKDQGFRELSLLCFEENTAAMHLYRSYGFKIIARRPVISHPLIRRSGDVLLMTQTIDHLSDRGR